jgi:hypothetical protein
MITFVGIFNTSELRRRCICVGDVSGFRAITRFVDVFTQSPITACNARTGTVSATAAPECRSINQSITNVLDESGRN